MALLGNVVVRRPGEPEVYAETADLHERFCPGNPDWGHPPLEDDARTADEGWGPVEDPSGLFGPTIVRWYPTVQWFDGDGFADHLRSLSLYRRLDRDVREPLLDAIAERIRTRMGDRAPRRYLSVLRVELATAEWVDWYNHRRLHGETGHIPPVEYETNFYTELTKPQVTTTI